MRRRNKGGLPSSNSCSRGLRPLGELVEKLKRGPEVLQEQWDLAQRRLRMTLAVWTLLGGETLVKCDDVSELTFDDPARQLQANIVREAIEEILDTLVEEN